MENCFDALYGVMLLRLQHKPISDETAKAVAAITKLLAMLSDYYKQDKAGELKFERTKGNKRYEKYFSNRLQRPTGQ